jgi:hypothetical protein
MSVQLALPARWAVAPLMSRRDPQDELARIARDKIEAKAEIREVLDQLAAKHGISAREIGKAVQGYTDDMLNDATYELERDLTREIEERDVI